MIAASVLFMKIVALAASAFWMLSIVVLTGNDRTKHDFKDRSVKLRAFVGLKNSDLRNERIEVALACLRACAIPLLMITTFLSIPVNENSVLFDVHNFLNDHFWTFLFFVEIIVLVSENSEFFIGRFPKRFEFSIRLLFQLLTIISIYALYMFFYISHLLFKDGADFIPWVIIPYIIVIFALLLFGSDIIRLMFVVSLLSMTCCISLYTNYYVDPMFVRALGGLQMMDWGEIREGLDIIKQTAKTGEPLGQLLLGEIYIYGYYGEKKDELFGLYMLELASKRGARPPLDKYLRRSIGDGILPTLADPPP